MNKREEQIAALQNEIDAAPEWKLETQWGKDRIAALQRLVAEQEAEIAQQDPHVFIV